MLLVKSGLRFSRKAVKRLFCVFRADLRTELFVLGLHRRLDLLANGCFMSLLLACSAAAGFAANFQPFRSLSPGRPCRIRLR
jgi:hypothetical protein